MINSDYEIGFFIKKLNNYVEINKKDDKKIKTHVFRECTHTFDP